jgi:GNAT superfamily N-acetyltransferase
MALDAGATDHLPTVRRFAAGDTPAATAIVQSLPDYFTNDVPAKVEHDAARHEAWAVTDPAGALTGFAISARKSPGGAEILWIAVHATRRGRGHGTRLLAHVLDDLAASGISVVEAKTLDQSSGYRPYEVPHPVTSTQRLPHWLARGRRADADLVPGADPAWAGDPGVDTGAGLHAEAIDRDAVGPG